MSERDAARRRTDVVILTTTRAELDAVLAVDTGALPGSAWELTTGPSGLPLAFRSYVTESGPPLRVAATVSPDLGATAAVHALMPLIEALAPRCVAMCGVCAGRRGKTQLGDVVAADRIVYWDTGKLFQNVQRDLVAHRLRDDWKVALEALDPVAQFRNAAWFQSRPLSTRWRENRALIALRNEAPEPWNEVEPKLGTEAWRRTVQALRDRGLLASSGRTLTDEGRREAEDLLFEHMGELPDLSPAGELQPFRLHVAPMGSGVRAIGDESIWGFVSLEMRKTLGIEVEAAVLGELVHRERRRQLDTVVMKGVMDFADHGRDDHFRDFAARAAAECLLWFLRRALVAERTASLTAGVRDRLDYSIERQRHSRFIGREAILAAIDRCLIADSNDRYVVVTGGPGMGKSAILAAWLARREAAGAAVPHHFIRRGAHGWDEPATITGSLAAQIEELFPAQRDPDARAESRLPALLARVSAHELAPHGDHLVLLIDGLDEYDAPAGVHDPLAAFLPSAVPNVRLLCSTRPRHPHLEALELRAGALVQIDLDAPQLAADNDRTVRAFWEREAAALELNERFVEQALACAGGNMQHAVMLRNQLDGLPPDQRHVEAVPRGLAALLVLLWRRVANSKIAVRGLGVLCAAREPLSLDEIGVVVGWDGTVQREVFARSTLELLVEVRRTDGVAAYRLHHDSIRAYIIAQIGPPALMEHHALLADKLAAWPAPADPAAHRYALRYALVHRVEAGDWVGVGQLAGDLGFLEAKCRELGVEDVEADLARVVERCRLQGNAAISRRLGDLARALTRESHWLRHEPEALPAQLWNRLRRFGWSADELGSWLRVPDGRDFVRVRHVLSRESPALLRDLIGHASAVLCCVVTPDGGRAISASRDRTLKVWDLDTGRALATLEGHGDAVNSCAVTPDGRLAASASSDGTIRIWDLAAARQLATLQGHTGCVMSCAIAPDGRRVVSASEDCTLKVWDLATGRMLGTFEGHTGWVMSCAFAPDGRRAISASRDRTLKVWDLDAGRVVTTLEGHTRSVMSCAVTPDGRRAISASRDRTLKVWDLDGGRIVATLMDHADHVNGCAVAPDSRRVVSASDDSTVKAWDLDTCRIVTTLEGHTGPVNSCVITPDGRRVISASRDGALKVWDLDT